jgi:chemotaxis methyl-accepting protein methylase
MTLAGAKLGVGADADFDYIRKLVADRAAIVLDDSKQYLVESRLLPLARSEGVTGLSGLVGRLRVRGPSDPLVTAVVEAMTTNETSFFRDPPVFETLRTSILPDLIAKRSAARRLRIWSAAASTGQEAYSVVMLLREHFPELSGWRVEVLGTDLSTAVLEKARIGVYSRFEVARGLSTERLGRWFRPKGADYQLDRSILDAVQFRPPEPGHPRPAAAVGPDPAAQRPHLLRPGDPPPDPDQGAGRDGAGELAAARDGREPRRRRPPAGAVRARRRLPAPWTGPGHHQMTTAENAGEQACAF